MLTHDLTEDIAAAGNKYRWPGHHRRPSTVRPGIRRGFFAGTAAGTGLVVAAIAFPIHAAEPAVSALFVSPPVVAELEVDHDLLRDCPACVDPPPHPLPGEPTEPTQAGPENPDPIRVPQPTVELEEVITVSRHRRPDPPPPPVDPAPPVPATPVEPVSAPPAPVAEPQPVPAPAEEKPSTPCPEPTDTSAPPDDTDVPTATPEPPVTPPDDNPRYEEKPGVPYEEPSVDPEENDDDRDRDGGEPEVRALRDDESDVGDRPGTGSVSPVRDRGSVVGDVGP